ncbi:hypothetical protein CASFOL_040242 [Castilleja foliolosa]|uniref:Ninja-family protein n=1 Tax=Castilleja foliolosa TaxID=1961234 RepID=A0ABD3BFF2_9LAMI
MEVLKVGLERECEEDEFELSLELSIGGGRYGKSIKMEGINGGTFEGNVSRSGFYCNDNKRDLELKRNIIIPQDLRKQESCVETEVKLILEGKQFRSGAENVEKDGILENSAREWEKNGKREIELDLNGDFEGQQMQKVFPAKSDARQSQCALRSNYMVKRLKVDNSYTTNNAPRSTDKDQSSPTPAKSSHLVKKPPKPPTLKTDGASVRHMPCVSTTGNGPNGKTITGFLYKYTINEVRIVCICHRRIFSPAEFVEHAGGVDILNPLRHITIVNSAQR